MKLVYTGDAGRTFACETATPMEQGILLTEADGLYGYEATLFTSDQSDQDGSTLIGSKLSARRIGLTLKIMADVVETRRAVIMTLQPKTVGTLKLLREGYEERVIRCVVEKVAVNATDGSILNVYLMAPNPYWRKNAESRVFIATWEALFGYPLTIEQGVGFMFGQRTEERVINVQNPGTAETGMRVVFTARSEVVNPRISDALHGERYMQAGLTLHENDILTIQTGKGEKRATLYRADGNVESNAFEYLDTAALTFLQLAPGNNYLTYSAQSGEDALTVAVFFYPCYVEV